MNYILKKRQELKNNNGTVSEYVTDLLITKHSDKKGVPSKPPYLTNNEKINEIEYNITYCREILLLEAVNPKDAYTEAIINVCRTISQTRRPAIKLYFSKIFGIKNKNILILNTQEPITKLTLGNDEKIEAIETIINAFNKNMVKQDMDSEKITRSAVLRIYWVLHNVLDNSSYAHCKI